MRELGRYDPNLEMFVDPPRDADLAHLKFLRRLAEQGKFGPRPFSRPRGDYSFRQTPEEIARYVRIEEEKNKPPFGTTKGEALLRHISEFGDY